MVNKLRKIFDRRTKIKMLILLAAIIFGAVLETLALALISPFISVLMDAAESPFLTMLSFALAAMYILRGIYMSALTRVQFRFLARRQATLSERLLRKLLSFSYIYHTGQNIAEFQRIIIRDVEQMFVMIINVLRLLTDFFISFFILIFLLIVSPVMTLLVAALAGLCVLFYFKAFRGQLREAGTKNREAAVEMTKTVNQALGGIKEVKVLHREDFFHHRFKACSDIFVIAFARFHSLNQMPKLIIETICFGGAFLLLGVFILGGTDIAGLVPQLSLFVVAAFRLLPALSRQVSYVNAVIFNHASVDAVYKSLFEENDVVGATTTTENRIDPGRDIVVKNLSFQYPNTATPVLTDVSFVIPEKKSVALIGSSGAGKTTLADIILGIITPNSGGVFYENRHVGYIPQQIYLLDETIRENVAFGIELDEIDDMQVWRALEQAQLKGFVESLPEKLNTIVGDRGIRLSGGQRQRLGIARAIYDDPPVLVLDEATSSLDDDTEKAVMEAVMGFLGNKTMLIVAHRLSTIEHCDIVYRVENETVTKTSNNHKTP